MPHALTHATILPCLILPYFYVSYCRTSMSHTAILPHLIPPYFHISYCHTSTSRTVILPCLILLYFHASCGHTSAYVCLMLRYTRMHSHVHTCVQFPMLPRPPTQRLTCLPPSPAPGPRPSQLQPGSWGQTADLHRQQTSTIPCAVSVCCVCVHNTL